MAAVPTICGTGLDSLQGGLFKAFSTKPDLKLPLKYTKQIRIKKSREKEKNRVWWRVLFVTYVPRRCLHRPGSGGPQSPSGGGLGTWPGLLIARLGSTKQQDKGTPIYNEPSATFLDRTSTHIRFQILADRKYSSCKRVPLFDIVGWPVWWSPCPAVMYC